MQVEELLQLSVWFKNNIDKNQIPQNYTKLYNKMNSNVRRQNNVQNQPFIDEKNILFSSLEKINFDNLTIEQIKFLKQLEVDSLINKDAIQKIKEDLTSNHLDISSATNVIKEYSDKVVSAQDKFKEINNLLSQYFKVNISNEIENDEILMRLYFQEGVSIDNLNDLKKLSNNWYDISRGIAMALNQTPDDFRVIGAKKGSIIIDLAVTVGIATVVSKILLETLKVADRVLDIRKKVEEIKSLKLSNKKIELELEREVDHERDRGIEAIVEETINQLNINKLNEGDKISAIEKSIKKLIDFTENGGQVDFVQSDKVINENLRHENQLLKGNIEKIRQIENKIKYIENN